MVVEFWSADPIPLLDVPPLDVAPLDVPLVDVLVLPDVPDVEPVDVEPVDVEPVDVEPVDVEPVDVEPVDVEVCELDDAVDAFAEDSATPTMTVAVSAVPTAATMPLASFARCRSRATRRCACGSYPVMHSGCGSADQAHLTESSSHS